MMNDWSIFDILYHPKLSDDFKFEYLEKYFDSEITDEIVHQEFKKWRANNIKSSNVKKIMYEDETKEMTIQFNDKSIYTYYEVPFDLFLDVSGGNAVCITSGENKYGRWWIGKTPSVGAAVHKFLVKKKIRYKKGGNFR